MRLLIALLMVVAVLPSSAAPGAEDACFAAFIDRTLDSYWKLNAEDAFVAGYYNYADQASIPSAAARRCGYIRALMREAQ
jgi:hypothetical protein